MVDTTPTALSAFLAAKLELSATPFTKDRTGHGYKYVPLEDIQRAITPVLAKHGLVLVDELTVEGSCAQYYGLTTTVYHVESTTPVASSFFVFNIEAQYGTDKRGNPTLSYGTAQDVGGWRTYAARYNRATVLDLVLVGEDDDGAALNRAEGGGAPKKSAPKVDNASVDW